MGKWGNGEQLLNGYGVSFGDVEHVLELDRDDGCVTSCMYWMPLVVHLKWLILCYANLTHIFLVFSSEVESADPKLSGICRCSFLIFSFLELLIGFLIILIHWCSVLLNKSQEGDHCISSINFMASRSAMTSSSCIQQRQRTEVVYPRPAIWATVRLGVS